MSGKKLDALEITHERGIVVATVSRPEVHNPLSLATIEGLGRAVAEAEAAGSSCLIVTGAGERTFCAGGDLDEFAGLRTAESAIEMSLRMQRVSRAMRRSPLVIIMAMNGDAYGGGLEFALAGDIRIAAEHARFGFYQVRLGITPAWRGAVRLREILPRSRAIMLMTSGRRFSAAEALQWGLVDEIAAGRPVLEAAKELAAEIAAHSPLAVCTIKRMIDAPRGDDDADLQNEAELFAEAWMSEAHWAAVAQREARRS